MCGIAGFLDPRGVLGQADLAQIAETMASTLTHRGPDDAGSWVDAAHRVGFGHRRLSIVDLSPLGRQPMTSACGRLVITYNGEIYNHQELRQQLAGSGRDFRGHSDTEVLLEAFATWGIEATLPKLIGMFAIAIWNRSTHELHLVRDRLGVKPLYWAERQGLVLFGSELQALVTAAPWQPRLDRGAVSEFLRFSYVPAPATVYEGVHKLEAGTHLRISAQGAVQQLRYWDLRQVAEQAAAEPLPDEPATVEALDDLLGDAVSRRMIADVPLGVLLSGGIDSSTVAALMQAKSSAPIRSFAVSVDDQAYDEGAHARAIADHLGTEHTELRLDADRALSVVPEIASRWDEPFGDASQLPTYLICALTREHVKVVLSGDGGDEVFAGYNRYLWAPRAWDMLSRLPASLRIRTASALQRVPEAALDRAAILLPGRLKVAHLGQKVHKLLIAAGAASEDELYGSLVSQWSDPGSVVINGEGGQPLPDRLTLTHAGFVQRMQFADTLSYLPDDILTKLDRASMAVGLEARVPLLDHRVLEFAWRLPDALRVADNQGKRALRQVLNRYVPAALVERPKAGFAIPLDQWLRGPLRAWADDLLSPVRLTDQGLLRAERISALWQDHQDGRNHGARLWNVLMLQSWLDHQHARS